MPVKTKTKTTTSKEAPVIRLGLMGSGELSPKSIKATYNELIASLDGTPHFVVPVTKELFNDGVKAVVEMLMENDIPFDAVTTPEALKVRNLKPFLSNAAKTVERQRGFNKFFVQTIVSGGDEGKLLVLFDPEDTVLEEVMQHAFDVDMPVLSFTQGLDELESADDDEAEEESDEDDEEAAEDDDDDEEPVSKTNGVGDLAAALRIIGQSLIDASKGL